MKYYQDITLLPDAEVSLGFIWGKVYQQIHLLLVEHKTDVNTSNIGISFPAYGDNTFPLGNQLRLLADSDERLKKANVKQWLQRLSDYIHIKSVKAIPEEVSEYVCFYRVNPKSQHRHMKQLERRVIYLSQKHGVGEEAMREQLLASIKQRSGESKLPYINVQSLSTPANGVPRHKFMLFIECEKANERRGNGTAFSCYGLSSAESGSKTFVPRF